MTLKLCSISAALALAFATAAHAQQTPRTDPTPRAERPAAERPAADRPAGDRKVKNAEEDRIEADAKAAKAKCDAMQGNAKDVCQQQAKAQEKIAKAELDAKHNPTVRNKRKVEEVKAEGAYEVAKEKCDDLKGNEKDACQSDAKAKYEQAKANISKQFAQRKDADSPRRAATGETRQPSAAGSTK